MGVIIKGHLTKEENEADGGQLASLILNINYILLEKKGPLKIGQKDCYSFNEERLQAL